MEHNGTTTEPHPPAAQAPTVPYSPEAIYREECAALDVSESDAATTWDAGVKIDGENSETHEILGTADEQTYRFLVRSVLLAGQALEQKRAAETKEKTANAYKLIALDRLTKIASGECVRPMLSTGQIVKCQHDHDDEQGPNVNVATARIPLSRMLNILKKLTDKDPE